MQRVQQKTLKILTFFSLQFFPFTNLTKSILSSLKSIQMDIYIFSRKTDNSGTLLFVALESYRPFSRMVKDNPEPFYLMEFPLVTVGLECLKWREMSLTITPEF